MSADGWRRAAVLTGPALAALCLTAADASAQTNVPPPCPTPCLARPAAPPPAPAAKVARNASPRPHPAALPAADTDAPPQAKRERAAPSERCTGINLRAAVGEPLSARDMEILRSECS